MLVALCTTAQPQWRFHLAFEDAIGASDTIWFIYDVTATQGMDAGLGEEYVPIDNSVFNVWMATTLVGGNGVKTLALPYSEYPYGSFPIQGSDYSPPLTIRWDTTLFHAPYLPNQPTSYIRHPRLCSQYFLWSGQATYITMDGCYSMFASDSVVIDPEWDNWLWTLGMVLSYDPPAVGSIGEHAVPPLDVVPNPARDRVVLTGPGPLAEVQVLDGMGRRVLTQHGMSATRVELDVSGLPAGAYLVHARGAGGKMYRARVLCSP